MKADDWTQEDFMGTIVKYIVWLQNDMYVEQLDR